MGERKFCYKCMEKFDMDKHICPLCGYDDTTPNNPMYITPGTILHDRYLVGILLDCNGEGATYAGYDISTGSRVTIREYMPVNLCTRVRNKATISVNYNNLAKYKAFMAEYTELNKSLVKLRNNPSLPSVLDMFSENNTTYTIFDCFEGIRLMDYLKENAGEISWEQVSKLFPPLFTAISLLHNNAIIHRAISPDTVYITPKNELKLAGFSVSSVRTVNAGMEYELFRGYAAPEQYSPSSSSHQGTWTDVYGICALLYRVLTGCMPNDSKDRLSKDELLDPRSLNGTIPQHVSNVIMEGMRLSSKNRIKTVTELVTRLFEAPGPVKQVKQEESGAEKNSGSGNLPRVHLTDNTPPPQPVYTQPPQPVYPQPQQYEQPYPQQYVQPQGYYDPNAGYGYDNTYADDDEDEYVYEKVNTVDRLKVPVIIAILLFLILMIIALVIIHMVDPAGRKNNLANNTSVVDDSVIDESEAETQPSTLKLDTEMPDLVGKFYELTEKKYKDFFTFEVFYEYNDYYEPDVIYRQDIEPHEMVAQGSAVKIWVSKGKESAIIPDYAGLSVSQYENKLKEAGISNYSLIASANDWAAPNTVTMLMIDGETVYAGDYYSNKNNSKLVVYYCPADSDGGNNYVPEVEPLTVSEATDPPMQSFTTAPTEFTGSSGGNGGGAVSGGGEGGNVSQGGGAVSGGGEGGNVSQGGGAVSGGGEGGGVSQGGGAAPGGESGEPENGGEWAGSDENGNSGGEEYSYW